MPPNRSKTWSSSSGRTPGVDLLVDYIDLIPVLP